LSETVTPAAAALPLEAAGLERVQLGLLAAIAATCLVSIFAAEAVFLTPAILVLVWRLLTRRTSPVTTPLDGPILAFAVWTLLSASFSPDPLASHESAKKLVLFTLLYVTIDSVRDGEQRRRVLDAVLMGGLAVGAEVLLQFYFLGYDTIDRRPRGFLGHYMTASGLLMCVLVLAATRLVFHRGPVPRPSREDAQGLGLLAAALVALTLLQRMDLMAIEAERLFVAGLGGTAAFLVLSRRPGWPSAATSWTLAAAAFGVCSWAVLLSQTRSAWLGTIAGLGVVALLRAPKLLWLLAAGVALILIFRPPTVIDRLTVTDASSRNRIYMWQAAIDMIRDKPIFGVGVDMAQVVYPQYRWPGAPDPNIPHLHSNAFHIAAERGLPCLVWWLWWVAAAMGDAFRAWRGKGEGTLYGVAAMGLLVAILVAGLFEYNFGDSEILMLVLLVSALPYTLRRPDTATA
jgi:O-antigen ligase